jgi:dipeptidyl aminopeptidase/acylaminoacyl peptidase
VPSVEQLVAMQQCSPVRHIDRVVAPTLMYLGAKDRRVPYSQL